MSKLTIKITSLVHSSRRTLNRINEHGPYFYFLREDNPACFLGQKAIYVQSERTQWLGWFPLSEIEIDPNPGNW